MIGVKALGLLSLDIKIVSLGREYESKGNYQLVSVKCSELLPWSLGSLCNVFFGLFCIYYVTVFIVFTCCLVFSHAVYVYYPPLFVPFR